MGNNFFQEISKSHLNWENNLNCRWISTFSTSRSLKTKCSLVFLGMCFIQWFHVRFSWAVKERWNQIENAYICFYNGNRAGDALTFWLLHGWSIPYQLKVHFFPWFAILTGVWNTEAKVTFYICLDRVGGMTKSYEIVHNSFRTVQKNQGDMTTLSSDDSKQSLQNCVEIY